jgi:hypothetical protein
MSVNKTISGLKDFQPRPQFSLSWMIINQNSEILKPQRQQWTVLLASSGSLEQNMYS